MTEVPSSARTRTARRAGRTGAGDTTRGFPDTRVFMACKATASTNQWLALKPVSVSLPASARVAAHLQLSSALHHHGGRRHGDADRCSGWVRSEALPFASAELDEVWISAMQKSKADVPVPNLAIPKRSSSRGTMSPMLVSCLHQHSNLPLDRLLSASPSGTRKPAQFGEIIMVRRAS